MTKYKAVIFDLDGTIIDTEHIWLAASRRLIESRGVVLDRQTESQLFRKIHGLAVHKSCLEIKNAAHLDDELADLVREKNCLARSLYCEGLSFIDGFTQFHAKVCSHNLRSAIATNATADLVAVVDSILNLRNFFGTHIYDVSHVNYVNKPDPALYLHAARQLAIEPVECIAVEDSEHGVTAAKKANMYCIAINTADNHDQLGHADIIVQTYSEIGLADLL